MNPATGGPLKNLPTVLVPLGDAVMMWIGDTVVGMIPLLAHWFTFTFSDIAPISVQPEACILTVVTSGLAINAIFSLAFEKKTSRVVSRITYFAFFMALFSLIGGLILYVAVITGKKIIDQAMWWVLATSLISSFALTTEFKTIENYKKPEENR